MRSRARRLDRQFQLAQRRYFDRRLGVETSVPVYSDELGLGDAALGHYLASPWLPLRAAFKRLRPGGDDVFADIGAGKGQAVLVAAQLRFKRAIGVELSEQLARVARENVDRARPKLSCADVEIVTADAREWPIPDDLSVVYLYSPFWGEVFDAILQRIFASYDANPRRLRIVYGFPWEHNRLLETGRVSVIDVRAADWPTRPGWWRNAHVIVTYEVVPAGGGAQPLPPTGWRAKTAFDYWSGPVDVEFALHQPGAPPRVSAGAH